MTLSKTACLLLGALGAVSLPLLSAPVPSPEEDPAEALPRAPKQSPPELVVSFWNTGEGLPVNEILDLKQTPDGYLWLGTHHGLVRFDGVQFETFFRAPRGLRYGARIAPLEVDGRGRLWAAPDASALICLEAGAFSDVLTNVAFLRARVVSLCGDGTNGVLWVDAEGGLGRIPMDPAGQVKLLAGEAGGASRWMRDFAGQLWLATPRSLRLYQSGGWRQVVAPARTTMVAAPRRAGGIWIAREAALRYVTADGSMRAVADFPWRGQSRVNCMWEDRHQRLWIGTVSQGLFCYASGQFEQVVPTSSSVTCLLEDRQDNLWAGTRGGGLIRVRQRRFFIHDIHRTGLRSEFVRSLTQDEAGRVWIATAEGGLSWWQDGTWHTLRRTESWPQPDVFCVCPAREGGVWIS